LQAKRAKQHTNIIHFFIGTISFFKELLFKPSVLMCWVEYHTSLPLSQVWFFGDRSDESTGIGAVCKIAFWNLLPGNQSLC